MKYLVDFSGTAHVTINDDRVILRITENRDSRDRPEGDPEWDEQSAYRNTLYQMSTRDEVLQMLLWNALANGVREANRLDGWADLARDAAETDVDEVQVEYVAVIEP